jgi:hypothetical protein
MAAGDAPLLPTFFLIFERTPISCSELLPAVANLRKANDTKQSIAERLREQDSQLQQCRTRAKDLEKRLTDMKDAARTGDPADILKRLEEGTAFCSHIRCALTDRVFADVEALRDKSIKALPLQIKAKKERLHRVRRPSCPCPQLCKPL